MDIIEDLTGLKFGDLTVIEKIKGAWKCVCACGNEKIVHRSHLVGGRIKSCGCRRRKHMMSDDRLYQIWHGMKDRCLRANGKHYEKYGARGISVCQEWIDSFEAFRDWAVSNGYREDLSIDRKDNDGPYSPENCRWATRKEQQSNRGNTVFLTHNNETHTLADWSRMTGVNYGTLRYRVAKGFTGEELFAPPKRNE